MQPWATNPDLRVELIAHETSVLFYGKTSAVNAAMDLILSGIKPVGVATVGAGLSAPYSNPAPAQHPAGSFPVSTPPSGSFPPVPPGAMPSSVFPTPHYGGVPPVTHLPGSAVAMEPPLFRLQLEA